MVKTLIRLLGQREEDIEIRFIGIRPGEKLYEEILIDEERMRSTNFREIFVAPPVESPNGNVLVVARTIIEELKPGDEAGDSGPEGPESWIPS